MNHKENLEKISISEETKLFIVHKLVEPSYKADIKNMIEGKKCWRITGQVFETVSKLMVAMSGIFSFSSGYYNNTTLSFIAGSVSCVSLALLQFSSFSYSENKKQSMELNVLLKKLDIDTIPIISRNTDNDNVQDKDNTDNTDNTNNTNNTNTNNSNNETIIPINN